VASDPVDPRYDPQFQRGYEPPEQVDAQPSRVPRRNPWLAVLWVLGVAMVVGGVWATWQSELLINSPNLENSVAFYVFPGVLQSIAPWLSGVGIATIAGTVFLYAARWRDR
jgi:uncharacterized membrane protein YhaH (DUF805 family)